MDRYIGKTYGEVGGCFGLLESVLNDQYGKMAIELSLERVDTPQVNDILEFPRHCGIVIEEGRVMHADVGRGVVVDDIRGPWLKAQILRVTDE